jgi:hypothetical protein
MFHIILKGDSKMYLSELEVSILSKDQIHKILFGDISNDGEY